MDCCHKIARSLAGPHSHWLVTAAIWLPHRHSASVTRPVIGVKNSVEMHSWPLRLYNIFTFSISVTIALLFATNLSSFLYTTESSVSVEKVSTSRPYTKSKFMARNSISGVTTKPTTDMIDLYLTVSYNVTSLFNWNVKQAYISIIAEWDNPSGPQKQTVWDTIVERKSSKAFDGKVKAKYPLNSYNLPNSLPKVHNVKLTMLVNIMPYAGFFKYRAYELDNVNVDLTKSLSGSS